MQVSPVVHALPSLQRLPLSGPCEHPAAGEHVSVVHGFWSSQLAVPLGLQVPVAQVSPTVHGLPSSHAMPVAGLHAAFAKLGWQLWHAGLAASSPAARHAPAILHQPLATGWLQTPSWHASFVHAKPSSPHTVPLPAGVWPQPLGPVQLSTVQGLPSEQLRPVPPHLPALHTSPVVHGLPSSHTPTMGTQKHGDCGALLLQLSDVQGSLSLQASFWPTHFPPTVQASPTVQALPSLQGKATRTDHADWLTLGKQPWQLSSVLIAPPLRHVP